ncbi:Multidrug resistance protein-like protein 49 [Diplonema papillatum]|nr:Multidrug resistance protein-like protein 49 [Diplonema papillatum]
MEQVVLPLAFGAAGCGTWWCLQAVRRRTAAAEADRVAFEGRARVWLAEQGDRIDDADLHTAENLFERATELRASESVRWGVARLVARVLADDMQKITGDPSNAKHCFENFGDLTTRVTRMADWLHTTPEALLDGLAPGDTWARFSRWAGAQHAVGWRALFRLSLTLHRAQPAVLLLSSAVGFIAPLQSRADAEYVEAVSRAQTDPAGVASINHAFAKLVTLEVLSAALGYGSAALANAVTSATERDIRLRAADRFARADLSFLASISTFGISDCLEADVLALSDVLSGIRCILESAVRIVSYSRLLRLSPQELTFCLGTACVFQGLMHVRRRVLRSVIQAPETPFREDFRSISDLFGDNFVVFRLLGREPELARCCAEQLSRAHDASRNLSSVVIPLVQGGGPVELLFSRVSAFAGLLAFPASPHVVGAFGVLNSIIAAASGIAASSRRISRAWFPALRLYTATERIPCTIDTPGGSERIEGPISLAFDGVSFSYHTENAEHPPDDLMPPASSRTHERQPPPERETKIFPPVLRGITFRVPAGGHLGIVGPSGCGKSTLLLLISRLYDPQSGAISIAEVDIRGYNARYLRREVVGSTAMSGKLMSMTLLDNVRCGRPDTPQEEVARVLGRLGAEFAFEKGLHAQMGWGGGVELSSGQEALVALARTVLGRPRILLLDEVSAHLDPQAEDRLRGFISEVAAEGTIVVNVSHRLSFLRGCDSILVLGANGAVDAQGPHSELLETCPWYAEACQKQSLSHAGEESTRG